eukprot:5135216-Pyramimonas_sp.AAC.1
MRALNEGLVPPPPLAAHLLPAAARAARVPSENTAPLPAPPSLAPATAVAAAAAARAPPPPQTPPPPRPRPPPSYR